MPQKRNANFVLSNFKMDVTREDENVSGNFLYIYNTVKADITKIELETVIGEQTKTYGVPQSGIIDLGMDTQLDKINVKLNDKPHGYTVALLDANKNIVWQENNEKAQKDNPHTPSNKFQVHFHHAWANYSQKERKKSIEVQHYYLS